VLVFFLEVIMGTNTTDFEDTMQHVLEDDPDEQEQEREARAEEEEEEEE
jgi:hypothetical protein